jgi:hypothetical protein
MISSRREFGKQALSAAALAALPLAAWSAKLASTVKGVKLGIITGSLQPFPEASGKDIIDTVVASCVASGAANIELVNMLEPRLVGAVNYGHPPSPMTAEYEKSRAAVREWRMKTPIDRFREIRRKFDAAGLNLFSHVMTFDMDFADEEIDTVFKQMQALKVVCFCTNDRT